MGIVSEADRKTLLDKIRNVPDFPKPGIQFKDITPMLGDPDTLDLTATLLAKPFSGKKVDFVAGLESRGFLFGPLLAREMDAGFIPVRKPGKLPAETLSFEYELEYGTDSLEVHKDALKTGANIIIHDDLIATGGTALAAVKLVEKLGGNIIGFSFIMELGSLKGKDILPSDVPYHCILTV